MRRCDKISFLPNEIQDQIVSYLPIEEAIRTSILSTRWRKVCYSLSNLDFDMRSFPFQGLRPGVRSTEAFKIFVNQVLTLHDDSDIHKFKLVFVHDDSDASFPPLINQWISFAINHNVRELHISIDVNQNIRELPIFFDGQGLPTPVVSPSSLFTSSSLTILSISATKIILPTNISIPNLKDLTLNLVKFVDDNDTKRLFLSSPVLERLSILSCFWMNFYNVGALLIHGPNLKFLKVQKVLRDIQLSPTTNLLQIWYQEDSPPQFSKEDVSSLIEATFICPRPCWPSNKLPRHWQSEILLGLSNVAKLTLRGWYIEYLSRELDLLARLPTSCSTLKHLVIDFYPTIEQLKVLILLLRGYPCLQTLHIYIEILSMIDLTMLHKILGVVDYVEMRELCTEAVLNQLARVEIEYFEGSEMELDLVRFLLRNATSLEIMNITLSSISQRRGKTSVSINDTIQMFPRVSPRAIITILDNSSES
ncbi:hypothetical protein ACHQM5_017840 [Ranunculus cassubicifolius]